jgi:YfiH family protein
VTALEEFSLHTAGGVTLGHWPALGPTGVEVVVTTRHGGVSVGPYESLNLALHVGDDPAAVLENRRRAAEAVGRSLVDLVFGEQVHGAGVTTVDRRHAGRGSRRGDDALRGVDALVTTDPAVTLVTQVADCVPLALFDPEARVLAVVHAGWRGTVAGVGDAALDRLVSLGGRVERTVAVIGPCVAPARYQVGPEVAAAVRARLGGDDGVVLVPDGDGHWRLDLAATHRLLLGRRGVGAERIVTCPWSTGGDGPFFSDRAARPCGRFALLARLHPYDGEASAAI